MTLDKKMKKYLNFIKFHTFFRSLLFSRRYTLNTLLSPSFLTKNPPMSNSSRNLQANNRIISNWWFAIWSLVKTLRIMDNLNFTCTETPKESISPKLILGQISANDGWKSITKDSTSFCQITFQVKATTQNLSWV